MMSNIMTNMNTQNLLWVTARAPGWIKWIWSLIKVLLREVLWATFRWFFGQSEQRNQNTLQSKLLIQWTSVVGELTFMWKS